MVAEKPQRPMGASLTYGLMSQGKVGGEGLQVSRQRPTEASKAASPFEIALLKDTWGGGGGTFIIFIQAGGPLAPTAEVYNVFQG